MAEAAGSIAHEINQPLAAIVTNGEACLRWLSDKPNNGKASAIVRSIISDANRAGEVIRGIRALLTNDETRRELLDVNQVTQETIALLREHAQSHDVQIKASLGSQIPRVLGDRIQLQKVVLNLLLNGIGAAEKTSENGTREVIVTTGIDAPESVLLQVRDCGQVSGLGISRESSGRFLRLRKAVLGWGSRSAAPS
jgi:C4-dicarboxylate-specific signal transduction histidine kinase